MRFSRAERWAAAANIVLVVVFGAWSLGVAYGEIPLSACCGVPSYVEAVLATLNFPSWLPAALAAKALYGQDFTAFIAIKQLVWTPSAGRNGGPTFPSIGF
ncbi:hypothetical protein [Acidovorax sp.]|uniref:hypothetical protein n=1 Tax=Acidovorax sp. TaxID=1872122 RepID=UPI00391C2192